MEIIQLNGISVQDRELQYGFSVSDGLKKYFTDEPFEIEYPENIASVPVSVLAVPFVCNVLPIVWIEDAELIVPELDEDFFNCLGEIKKGYVDMYPEVEWKGKISVEKIVKAPDWDVSKKSIALFSGGVDATTTLLRHIDENPLLVTLWGADIAYDNAAGWNTVYSAIQASAVEYGVKNTYIRSSFRKFDNEGALDGKYRQILGKGWWYGVRHGIAILGHITPLAYLYGVKNVYIASSNCPEDGEKVKCASDPRIDNMVRFCGSRVFHDGFELDRQKKVQYVIDYHKHHLDQKINLHVCWESPTGKNCCRCEKCYRTMLEFWTEGEDPKSYGFAYGPDVFDGMYRCIALNREDMARKTWTRTKNRLAGNWPQIEKESYAEKIRWVLDYDFMNLENNPCRIRYQKKQRLKHILRQCVNPKAVFRKVFPKLYKMAGMVKHHPMIMNRTDEERETGLRKLYYERTGEVLDFDHAETFNEKIQ